MKYLYLLISTLVGLMWLTACEDHTGASEPETDDYLGQHTLLTLGDETASLTSTDIELIIQTPDGQEITRRASHRRSGDRSTIRMDQGLREGTYRLLAAIYDNPDSGTRGEFPTVEYGLGSRIEVKAEGISILDPFDSQLGYAGRGTKDSPYIISSSSHLLNLMLNVNDYDSWQEIAAGTYFKQVRDIDMKQASRSCDIEYGWLPIGADTNTPFRGVYLGDGHIISNLSINRPTSPGVGLFGYLLDCTIDGLTMSRCSVTGQFAVGSLAGASITSAYSRGTVAITNCAAENCTVSGNETSVALGTLLGGADMYTKTLLANCTVTDGSVSGGMNVGGILGGTGIYSSTSIENCTNSARITSDFSGAGGIVGTADTLQVVSCRNAGAVVGSRLAAGGGNPGVGSGGIAGGTGISWLTASENTGDVSGHEGVGGIIGSTRVRGSQSEGYLYNQSVLRFCSNTGNVQGKRFVGGAIGEAQSGGYGVMNRGAVKGSDYIGGICGNSSVSVIHNSANAGTVEGERYVSGIVGKTTWGSLALNQNYGHVAASAGIAGGVVGLAGNNTVVHYCSNFGEVSGPSSHPVGGIVGEIGDPRKWTAANIAECVVGSLECLMAMAGPVLAIAEHAIEMAEAVEVVLKIGEFTAESMLQIADYTLLGFGIAEMVSPEAEEELSSDIKAETQAVCSDIASKLRELRQGAGGSVANFNTSKFNSHYTPNILNLQSWYEQKGHDEHFNERINEAREARAEKLEKVAQGHEIFHTVVAGVAVVTSTVTLIAGTVATGGAATAILVAGSAAAIVGGVNAIVKSCTEFEHNAVVISQCVNAGKVSSHGNDDCGTIVGRLYDGGQLRDNLNAASYDSKSDHIIYGSKGAHCDVDNNVSTYIPKSHTGESGTYTPVTLIACDATLRKNAGYHDGVLYLSPDLMATQKYYTDEGFDFSSKIWTIPSGADFPIPTTSTMTK